MTMIQPATITAARRDFLLNTPNACTRWGQVTLSATAICAAAERRFVLSGPSGCHSLLVPATDAARLNAHWQAFCAVPANFPTTVERN